MKKNIKIKSTTRIKSKINPFKTLTRLIKRFNLVIFIVIVVIGLIFAILTLTNIITQPAINGGSFLTNSKSSTTSDSSSVFNQETIDKLDKLQTAGNNSSAQTLPSGRINPFSE